MPMIRFLAFSDLHLGRSSSGIAHHSGVSTNVAWHRIVDYAIEKKVDAVLMGGDCIDRDNKFFEAVAQMAQGFRKLAEKNIPVYMVAGNHDYESLPKAIQSTGAGTVHLLGARGVWQSMDLQFDQGAVRLVGWSFSQQHYRRSPFADFDGSLLHTDHPVIGLLHCDFAKGSPYAPVNEADFAAKAADYWLLGHIHKRQDFETGGVPFAYPGSPQALDPSEQGEHGVTLLEVEGKGRVSTRFVPLSPVRYLDLEVDLTDAQADQIRPKVINAVRDKAEQLSTANTRLEHLVMDVHVTGRQKDFGYVKNQLEGYPDESGGYAGNLNYSVRKLTYALQPEVEDLQTLAEEKSPAGSLARLIIALDGGESTAATEKLRETLLSDFNHLARDSKHRDLMQRGREQKYEDAQREALDEVLLNECKNLLSSLIAQKQEG